MRYLLTLEKYFTQRSKKILDEIYKIKINDIVDEDLIYSYIQVLHSSEDFVDGDIGKKKY